MERRDFLQASSLFFPFGVLADLSTTANNSLAMKDLKNPLTPFYIPPATPLDHKGNMDIRVLVRSNMTGGIYSCVECAVAPKIMGPPPHYHKKLDELMYVVEGTASVIVDGKEVQVETGGWHFRPRGLEHTFWNAEDKPLRFVDMYFNQPFEEFLEKIFHELTPDKYPWGSPQREKETNILNKKFGLVYHANSGEQRNIIAQKYGLS